MLLKPKKTKFLRLLEKNKMTAYSIAHLCGLSGSSVRLAALGQAVPRLSNAIKLASALGVDVFDIWDKEEFK